MHILTLHVNMQTYCSQRPRPVSRVRARSTTSSSFSSCVAPSSSPAALGEAILLQYPAIAAIPELQLPECLYAHNAFPIFLCRQRRLMSQTQCKLNECCSAFTDLCVYASTAFSIPPTPRALHHDMATYEYPGAAVSVTDDRCRTCGT